MKNSELIKLPSGDSVRPLAVSAVRIFKGFKKEEGHGAPCVFVDTGKGEVITSIKIEVDSHEKAIELAECITNEVGAAREVDSSATRRKVIVYENRYSNTINRCEKIESGIGEFCQFGLGVEEDGNGFTNFSVAIVEMPDGTVLTPPANMIKFINDESESGNGTNTE